MLIDLDVSIKGVHSHILEMIDRYSILFMVITEN